MSDALCPLEDEIDAMLRLLLALARLAEQDLAIFEPGAAHALEHLARVVICEKEPSNWRKGAYKMRSSEEAEKEFGLLKGDDRGAQLSLRAVDQRAGSLLFQEGSPASKSSSTRSATGRWRTSRSVPERSPRMRGCAGRARDAARRLPALT